LRERIHLISWEKELNTIAIEEKEPYHDSLSKESNTILLPRYYGELIVATVSSPPFVALIIGS
jgi:hypothetical protein